MGVTEGDLQVRYRCRRNPGKLGTIIDIISTIILVTMYWYYSGYVGL